MRLLLLGDPVAHSRSPAIHTAALREAGITGWYRARRVDPAGFGAALLEMREGRFDGANVTMPYKKAAAAAIGAADDAVARTGVANTLRRIPVEAGRARLEATNTDVAGIITASAAAGIPARAPVLVLGRGGAAAAALAAFGSRVAGVAARGDLPPGWPAWPWGHAMEGAVLVNATPLGMGGEDLPPGLVESAAGLVDLPYGGGAPTPAANRARRLGLPLADGVAVLVGQAAVSFTWWTGREAPLEVMRRAAGAA